MPNTPGCSPGAPRSGQESSPEPPDATSHSVLTGDCARAPQPTLTILPAREGQPSGTLLQPWPRCYVTLGI